MELMYEDKESKRNQGDFLNDFTKPPMSSSVPMPDNSWLGHSSTEVQKLVAKFFTRNSKRYEKKYGKDIEIELWNGEPEWSDEEGAFVSDIFDDTPELIKCLSLSEFERLHGRSLNYKEILNMENL